MGPKDGLTLAPNEPERLLSPSLSSIQNGGEGGRRPGEEAHRGSGAQSANFVRGILTQALPGEREQPLFPLDYSSARPTNSAATFHLKRRMILPLLGERAGVRASVPTNILRVVSGFRDPPQTSSNERRNAGREFQPSGLPATADAASSPRLLRGVGGRI